jgi:hypothetical protein
VHLTIDVPLLVRRRGAAFGSLESLLASMKHPYPEQRRARSSTRWRSRDRRPAARAAVFLMTVLEMVT